MIEYGLQRTPAGRALAVRTLRRRSGLTRLAGKTKQRGVSASSVIREAEEIDNGTITQDGIAQVFARRFKDRLRYCHHTGAWFEWTGTYWKKDETALAFQFCRELAREFTEESDRAK